MNVTSVLFASGVAVDDAATAELTVEPPPTFAKEFDPDTTPLGVTSTLTFTIDNSASTVDATALDFSDSLPGRPSRRARPAQPAGGSRSGPAGGCS